MFEFIQTPCGDHQGKVAAETVIDVANNLAKEGWELVSVCPNPHIVSSARWQLVAFFKREKVKEQLFKPIGVKKN